MTKFKLLIYFILINNFLFAQIDYKKGYFIDNTNKKTECLIQNLDWKNNPTYFNYKLLNEDKGKKALIENIKEFSVNDSFLFKRKKVNIDRSSDQAAYLSNKRAPIFNQETLFLKALLIGKIALYEYVDKNLKRYFYEDTNGNVTQLIYKRYTSNEFDISVNKDYAQFILNNFNCLNYSESKIAAIDYNRTDLFKFFKAYNQCINGSEFYTIKKKTKGKINLSLRPSFNLSSLEINNTISNSNDSKFDTNSSFGFGFEFEYFLPFNQNKFSIILEPSYQTYKSEKRINYSAVSTGFLDVKVDYNSINLPLGLRYSIYFSEKSRLFINTSYIFNISSKAKIDFNRIDGSDFELLTSKPKTNFAFGIGYQYNGKFSIEIRQQTSKDITSNYAFWNSGLNTTSFIIGYTLL